MIKEKGKSLFKLIDTRFKFLDAFSLTQCSFHFQIVVADMFSHSVVPSTHYD